MAPSHHPECPDGAPSDDPAAFKAHSLSGGGSGLVQSVFRSPARPRTWVPPRRGSCAAPPSEKRSALSRVISRCKEAWQMRSLRRASASSPVWEGQAATPARRSPLACSHSKLLTSYLPRVPPRERTRADHRLLVGGYWSGAFHRWVSYTEQAPLVRHVVGWEPVDEREARAVPVFRWRRQRQPIKVFGLPLR
jgi:hypothetical protein